MKKTAHVAQIVAEVAYVNSALALLVIFCHFVFFLRPFD